MSQYRFLLRARLRTIVSLLSVAALPALAFADEPVSAIEPAADVQDIQIFEIAASPPDQAVAPLADVLIAAPPGTTGPQPVTTPLITGRLHLPGDPLPGSPAQLLNKDGHTVWFADNTPASKYWIGIQPEAIDPIYHSLLNIAAETGLLVTYVIPDSPAAKVGFKEKDIILTINDANVLAPEDLVKLVGASEGKELTVKLAREGKEMTLTVTPAERPNAQLDVRALPADAAQSLEKLRALGWNITPPQRGGGGAEPHKALLADVILPAPGVVFNRPMTVHAYPAQKKVELPDDLEITIRRSGKKPPQITVKRGDEVHEVIGDNLDTIPENIRKHVQALLTGPQPIMFDFQNAITSEYQPARYGKKVFSTRALPVPGPATAIRVEARPVGSPEGTGTLTLTNPAAGDSAALQKQLEAMQEQLKAIQAQLDKQQKAVESPK